MNYIVVLSPAKTLDLSAVTKSTAATVPALLEHVAPLLASCQALKLPELKKLMSVSDNIARLNYDRYAGWGSAPEKQAALCFDGPAYRGFAAASFSSEVAARTQSRVRIL